MKKGFIISFGFCLICLILLGGVSPVTVSAATFTVTTNGDADDYNPGDGNCNTSSSPLLIFCTLRAAIEEANALFAANNSDTDFEIRFGSSLSPIVLTADLPLIRVPNLVISGVAATATIVDGDNSFRAFRSYKNGGAIDQDVVSLTLRDLTVQKCATTTTCGAAVAWYNYDLTIERASFFSNSADSAGAVCFAPRTDTPARSGNLLVSDSLFYGNSADAGLQSGGGGLTAGGHGQVTILNTTFEANSANGYGGAMILSNVTGTLIGLTVTDNVHLTTAYGYGGGIYFQRNVEDYSYSVGNSVIASNSDYTTSLGDSPRDCYVYGGGIISLGNNLIGDDTLCAGFDDPSDITGSTYSFIDPQLGALAFHGGFTKTRVPDPDSPLIDAGNNSTCSNHDQRGVPRPQYGGIDNYCDIGATEYSHCDDGSLNADERDTDCGGSICSPCTCPNPDDKILVIPSGSPLGTWYSAFSTAIFYAGDGSTLRVLEDIFLGDVSFSKASPTALTLLGGYDCDAGENSGYYTRIKGTVTVAGQTSLTAENIIIL